MVDLDRQKPTKTLPMQFMCFFSQKLLTSQEVQKQKVRETSYLMLGIISWLSHWAFLMVYVNKIWGVIRICISDPKNVCSSLSYHIRLIEKIYGIFTFLGFSNHFQTNQRLRLCLHGLFYFFLSGAQVKSPIFPVSLHPLFQMKILWSLQLNNLVYKFSNK